MQRLTKKFVNPLLSVSHLGIPKWFRVVPQIRQTPLSAAIGAAWVVLGTTAQSRHIPILGIYHMVVFSRPDKSHAQQLSNCHVVPQYGQLSSSSTHSPMRQP